MQYFSEKIGENPKKNVFLSFDYPKCEEMKKMGTKRTLFAALMLATTAAAAFAASENEGSSSAQECASIEPLSHSILPKEKLTLWYDTPSTDWMDQSLPIGNGQFGAMFFGGVRREEVQFNDKTLWTGTSGDPNGAGSGYGSYRNFGNLYINSLDAEADSKVTNYRRQLDIQNAVGRVSYSIGGVDYEREYIASYPADVVALLLKASGNGNVNVGLSVIQSDFYYYVAGNNRTEFSVQLK